MLGLLAQGCVKGLRLREEIFFIVDKRQSQTFPHKTRIADIRDVDALRKVVDGDVIINLAAEHRDDVTPRSLYDEVNSAKPSTPNNHLPPCYTS